MVTGSGPVYRRVLEDLRAQILQGRLEPGARVPSRNQVIARYGVGETAAKHALAVLATEGLIETRAGSGSYVRPAASACRLEHDRPHFPGSPFGLPAPRPAADGEARGDGPVVSWEHLTEQGPPPVHVARRLGLGEADLVTRTRYLLTADGHPVQFATSYEPASLTEGSAVTFPEEGPFAGRGVVDRMRAAGVIVDDVVEDISARSSRSQEALWLAITAGAPVLVVQREHRAGPRTVEFGEIIIPAGRFHLRYRLPPGPATALPSGTPAAQPGDQATGRQW